MTEEVAAPVEDINMPPDTSAESSAPSESAPAIDETPGIDTAASEEKTLTETEAKQLAQGRINDITADKHTERRRADKAEAELAELKGKPAPEQPEPKLEDFDYDEGKFNAALATYHGQKAATDAVSNYKTEQAGIEETNRQTEINNVFDGRVVDYRKTVPDYDQIVSKLPLIPGDVMDEIMQNENGPQLAHYLGEHLDVAENITLMKLGQISAQLATTKPTKQPSAAPDPIEPVKPGGTLNKKMEDMSMEEIFALPNTR